MQFLDKFFFGAFVLIGLFLVLKSENTGDIINVGASSTASIFRTLQGR